MYRVFASTREEELAVLPWSPSQKDAFLRQQFTLQDRQYRSQLPAPEFLVIEVDGVPAGRLYIRRDVGQIEVMDIALLPQHRGAGVGSALMEAVLDEARAVGARVRLHVEASNPARRLYARLGFVVVEPGPVYDRLEWRANEPVAAC